MRRSRCRHSICTNHLAACEALRTNCQVWGVDPLRDLRTSNAPHKTTKLQWTKVFRHPPPVYLTMEKKILRKVRPIRAFQCWQTNPKKVIKKNEAILRNPGARKHFDGSLITPSREPIQNNLASGISNSSRQWPFRRLPYPESKRWFNRIIIQQNLTLNWNENKNVRDLPRNWDYVRKTWRVSTDSFLREESGTQMNSPQLSLPASAIRISFAMNLETKFKNVRRNLLWYRRWKR